ncbi:hypothetical protein ANCDUO_19597 [Ancylostoma duodenale]|uniref:Methyltransferase FkbM domain-containing protein n=1 Tax=Ancylostoma duodenale TaxID=51022 RepID=A0A0C2FUG2_9BILA|nr:hypothetical protein ANCDUO_19597 [Ancylostoma duodenale]
MIDIEHAEYPMLPFLLQSGQLARDGVVICQVGSLARTTGPETPAPKILVFLQMNIEVHRPNPEQLQQFFTFYNQLMQEQQWTLMSASSIIGHLRLFMINHGSQECHDRYIGDIYDKETLATEDS